MALPLDDSRIESVATRNGTVICVGATAWRLASTLPLTVPHPHTVRVMIATDPLPPVPDPYRHDLGIAPR